MPSIFIIDNYDSFTFNLVHLVEQMDVDYAVKRNDNLDLEEVANYSHVLIGPGPGLPSESGRVLEVIEAYKHTKSMLGVCLGMQALLETHGGEMSNMPIVQHGAKSKAAVKRPSTLFHHLPDQFNVGRYHSWAFRPENVPAEFRITAQSEDAFIMAVEHSSLPLFGVQFHPESIMTEGGLQIMQSWLEASAPKQ